MSKKAAKLEELSELVLEDKILSVLLARLTELLTPMMKELVKQLASDVTTELKAALTEHLDQKISEITTKTEEKVDQLENKLKSMENTNILLQKKVDDLERHSRINNLVFYGVPEALSSDSNISSAHHSSQTETEQSLTSTIIQICHDRLNINLNEYDISTVHRLPGSAKLLHKPLIVSFTNRRSRNAVYGARKRLRSATTSSSSPWEPRNQLFINEHLTKSNAYLSTLARRLVKENRVASTWTSGGLVYIKMSTSMEESSHRILTPDDLYKYAPLLSSD